MPKIVTFTDVEFEVLRAALDDAYAYRLGDAAGRDDPDLDPIDAHALRHIHALCVAHPELDGAALTYPDV